MSPEPAIDDLALHGELSANLVGFCRFLRQQGCGIGPGEERDALRALAAIDLKDPQAFHLTLRTTLAKTPEEQTLFDKLFDHYWQIWARASELNKPQPNPERERAKTAETTQPRNTAFTSVRDWLKQGEPTEEEREAAGYSPIEVETQRNFKDFGAAELREMGRLLQTIARVLATRFSRRYRPAKKPGRLDLRRTLRANLRRGGELLDLSYRRRTRQKPKLVLLCDVSKSMDLYSRFLIQFIYAFQHAYRRIETFVFSTSLHHIAPMLKSNDIDEALDELAAHVPDWSGGTRIGTSLATFLDEHAALVDHQTVLLIVSDGWDTGDIELLADSMHALQRRSRCLIWLNPLLGSADYKPTTRGMAAALPHIDLFAPVHNLQSLKDLVRYLMALRGATAVRRPPRRIVSEMGASHRDAAPPSEPTNAGPTCPTTANWLQRFGVQS